jgi:hypothetical protein
VVEPVVARERQERGVEPDRLPAALEDGAFEVVVQHHPEDRAERIERHSTVRSSACGKC